MTILDVASLVLAVCAAALTGVYLRGEFVEEERNGTLTKVRRMPRLALAQSSSSETSSAHIVRGFMGFCGQFGGRTTRHVGVIYRHLRIQSKHVHARQAGLASQCAAIQLRFNPYHGNVLQLIAEGNTDRDIAKPGSLGDSVGASRVLGVATEPHGAKKPLSGVVNRLRATRPQHFMVRSSYTPTIASPSGSEATTPLLPTSMLATIKRLREENDARQNGTCLSRA